MKLEGIDHIAMAVPDVEKTAQWYIEVLGFETRFQDVWGGHPTFIGLGTTAIALFPGQAQQVKHGEKRVGFLHLAFRADAKQFAAAQEELKKRDIRFEFQDHEVSHSIYFLDPDGYRLEITTYELPKS